VAFDDDSGATADSNDCGESGRHPTFLYVYSVRHIRPLTFNNGADESDAQPNGVVDATVPAASRDSHDMATQLLH
jgi:hypothetical protein